MRPYLLNIVSDSIQGAVFANVQVWGSKLSSDLLRKGYTNPSPGQKRIFPDLWKKGACGNVYHWQHGRCHWCPFQNQSHHCVSGLFRFAQFRDDNRAYSLKTRGTLDLLASRPFHSNTKLGKASVDQVYLICSQFQHKLPFDQPGYLTIDNMPRLFFPVGPKPSPSKSTSLLLSSSSSSSPVVRNKTVVCTKAFYGFGINANTVLQFCEHYFRTWKFDFIYLYELGTTMGTVLLDVILSHAVLANYYLQGRIILIDLRDELQRYYGTVSQTMVLFSSKNGQLVVSSDCLNRVKTRQDLVGWVLHVDWDEILMPGVDAAGGNGGSQPWESFSALVQEQEKVHPEMQVLYFDRHRASEESICTLCEDKRFDPTVFHGFHTIEHEIPSIRNSSLRTETARKYAIRISSLELPFAWGYGVHEVSRCAFSLRHEQKTGMYDVDMPLTQVYLRHYKCMNKRQHGGCKSPLTLHTNWPLAFGSQW